MKAYSQDLRDRVIALYKTKKYTKLTDDISKDNIYEYNVYAINSFATQFKRIYEISWSEIIKKISIILN